MQMPCGHMEGGRSPVHGYHPAGRFVTSLPSNTRPSSCSHDILSASVRSDAQHWVVGATHVRR